MNATKNQLEYTLAVLIVMAICVQLAVAFYHAWPFTTDDAFISWRYAKHLAQSEGLRWNLANLPVEGYSNFAWMILVSLFIKLGLPITVTIKYFACLSLLAALLFLYQFARTFLSPLPATLPVYLFSHYNGVVWWTVSGLETSFFVALVVFVSWQSARAMGFTKLQIKPHTSTTTKFYYPSAWIMSCLGLTVLALTRFEASIWTVVLGIFIVCSGWHSAHFRPYYRSLLLIFIVCFVLPYASYFAWRVLYFGRFLPNSYSCKAFINGYTLQLVIDYLLVAFPCLMLSLPYLLKNKDCRHVLLWLPSLIYSILLFRANPNIAYYNRLFLGALSVFSLLPILGVQEFFDYFHCKARTDAVASTIVILLFTHLFVPGNQIETITLATSHYQQRSEMRLQVALLLNREASKNAQVLIADSGLIPFYGRHDIQFIDSLCLNNSEMTDGKIYQSRMSYAKRIQDIIKPEWVIDTYYPKLEHGNDINDQLRNMGFFNSYTLRASYQSHRFSSEKGNLVEQEADFVYRIYQRK